MSARYVRGLVFLCPDCTGPTVVILGGLAHEVINLAGFMERLKPWAVRPSAFFVKGGVGGHNVGFCV